MSARFLMTTPIPQPAVNLLERAGDLSVCAQPPTADELARLCASGDYDVLISQLTDRLPAALLGQAKLSGIANYAVGVDNIDVTAATQAGIVVANTPGVLTDPTADIAFLLILATARRCIEGDAMVRAGEFTGWKPDLLLGQDVTGARLGIIGSGRIAVATARRAAGFDMEVVHCSARGPHDEVPAGRSDDAALGDLVSFNELIETSDFVSLHIPLSTQTRHLVDADVLVRMKPTAILINTARGPIVDEDALVTALGERRIAGAGLDVYENEPRISTGLEDLTNAVLLPHLGSATVQVRAKMAELTALNAVALARGELPPHPVNPEAREVRRDEATDVHDGARA